MALQTTHQKLIEARQKCAPITTSSISVDVQGKLNYNSLDAGVVEGYAIIWGQRSLTGYKFLKGCCSRSIQEHGPKSGANYQIKFLLQHDQNEPMALLEELVEDEVGLRFKTKPLDLWDLPGSAAYRLIAQLKSKTINNFSHGYDWIWDKTSYDDTDDSLVAAEIQLFEISAVTIPAGMNTRQIQSVEELGSLQEDISDFISTLPQRHRMQARQLFTIQHSLINTNGFGETGQQVKDAKKEKVLTNKQSPGIDFDYLLKHF